MNNRQIAARRRARRELEKDPLIFAKRGAKGGKAKVPKGLAKVSREARIRIAKSGGSAPRKV